MLKKAPTDDGTLYGAIYDLYVLKVKDKPKEGYKRTINYNGFII